MAFNPVQAYTSIPGYLLQTSWMPQSEAAGTSPWAKHTSILNGFFQQLPPPAGMLGLCVCPLGAFSNDLSHLRMVL